MAVHNDIIFPIFAIRNGQEKDICIDHGGGDGFAVIFHLLFLSGAVCAKFFGGKI